MARHIVLSVMFLGACFDLSVGFQMPASRAEVEHYADFSGPADAARETVTANRSDASEIETPSGPADPATEAVREALVAARKAAEDKDERAVDAAVESSQTALSSVVDIAREEADAAFDEAR